MKNGKMVKSIIALLIAAALICTDGSVLPSAVYAGEVTDSIEKATVGLKGADAGELKVTKDMFSLYGDGKKLDVRLRKDINSKNEIYYHIVANDEWDFDNNVSLTAGNGCTIYFKTDDGKEGPLTPGNTVSFDTEGWFELYFYIEKDGKISLPIYYSFRLGYNKMNMTENVHYRISGNAHGKKDFEENNIIFSSNVFSSDVEIAATDSYTLYYHDDSMQAYIHPDNNLVKFQNEGHYEIAFYVENADGKEYNPVFYDFYIDKTAPTAAIEFCYLNDEGKEVKNTYKNELHNTNINYNIIANHWVDFSVQADDKSGIKSLSYVLREDAINPESIKSNEWKDYWDDSFSNHLKMGAKNILYVKAEDYAGHTAYYSSNGVIAYDSLENRVEDCWYESVEEGKDFLMPLEEYLYGNQVETIAVDDVNANYEINNNTLHIPASQFKDKKELNCKVTIKVPDGIKDEISVNKKMTETTIDLNIEVKKGLKITAADLEYTQPTPVTFGDDWEYVKTEGNKCVLLDGDFHDASFKLKNQMDIGNNIQYIIKYYDADGNLVVPDYYVDEIEKNEWKYIHDSGKFFIKVDVISDKGMAQDISSDEWTFEIEDKRIYQLKENGDYYSDGWWDEENNYHKHWYWYDEDVILTLEGYVLSLDNKLFKEKVTIQNDGENNIPLYCKSLQTGQIYRRNINVCIDKTPPVVNDCKIISLSATSVTYAVNMNDTGSVMGYVYYFNKDENEWEDKERFDTGWMDYTKADKQQAYTINGLKPDTDYFIWICFEDKANNEPDEFEYGRMLRFHTSSNSTPSTKPDDNNQNNNNPSNTTPNKEPNVVTTTETRPDGTKVETRTVTVADGTSIVTVTETRKDKSQTIRMTTSRKDGSWSESVTEVKANGDSTTTTTDYGKDGKKTVTVSEKTSWTKSDGTKVVSTVTTKADGSKTEITTETAANGDKSEKIMETHTNGDKTEKNTETKKDGTKTVTEAEIKADGSKKETITETKADGTKTVTKTDSAKNTREQVTTEPDGAVTIVTETSTNADGWITSVSTTTKKDASGNVTKDSKKSVIENPAREIKAVVTVKTGKNGNQTAKASVTVTGTEKEDGVRGTLSAGLVNRIKEEAETDDIAITQKVKDSFGDTMFTLKVSTVDLVAGEKLYIVKVNQKTGETTLVNKKKYKVTESGSVSVTMDKKGTYQLVDKDTADEISDSILETVKLKTSSKAVKPGKTSKVEMSGKLNMENVSKITYTSSNKSVATVTKNGKVKAKKPGSATVKAKVTLKNGKTKTVKMKIKVRK